MKNLNTISTAKEVAALSIQLLSFNQVSKEDILIALQSENIKQLIHYLLNNWFPKASIQAYVWYNISWLKKPTRKEPNPLIYWEKLNRTRKILQGISWISWWVSQIAFFAKSYNTYEQGEFIPEQRYLLGCVIIVWTLTSFWCITLDSGYAYALWIDVQENEKQ